MKKVPLLIILLSVSFNYILAQSATVFDSKGDSLWKAGKNEEAIDNYTHAINLWGNNKLSLSSTYDMRARCYRNLQKYLQAINDDSYALKLNPQNADAYWNRAISYLYNGDYQLSINDYSHTMLLLKDEKTSLGELYRARGYNEMRLRQNKKAIEDCDSALLVNPESAYKGNIYRQKGATHSQNGDFKLAIDDYEMAISYSNDHKETLAELYNNCAINYYFLKEYQKVVDNCTKSILIDSEKYSPYYNRGKAIFKMKDSTLLAQQDFKKVLLLDTSKISISYIFSLFYLGDHDQAYNKMYEKILKTSNSIDISSTYYNMACLLSLMSKPADSMLYLRKAIEGGYSKKYPMYDEDFDNVKNSKEFQDILADTR